MKDQNSQFDDISNGRNASEYTYSYVFSSGEGKTSRPQAPRGHRSMLTVIALVLCVCLSLAGGIGGALLINAREQEGQTENDDYKNAAPDPDEVLHNDPESVLVKGNSSDSIYGSAGDDPFAVSSVVRAVQDAVVVINVRYASYMGYAQSGTGSGVIISEKGYILTCHHVVEDASGIEVVLNSGETFGATLVGSDADSDLAVIMIDPGDTALTYAKQGCSEDLVVGESVVAIGNPLGMGLTATTGIISATERRIEMSDGNGMTLLQTDAAINSGNSGGGLFNLAGELIGVVNAKYSASGVEGLAFAIPIDSAYEVETQLIRYGYVRGIVDHGLVLLEVTQSNLYQAYRQFGIQKTGLYVYQSEYCDELQALDRIVSLNGEAITDEAAFDGAIDGYAVGDTVILVVARDQKTVTVALELREYVPDRLKKNAD